MPGSKPTGPSSSCALELDAAMDEDLLPAPDPTGLIIWENAPSSSHTPVNGPEEGRPITLEDLQEENYLLHEQVRGTSRHPPHTHPSSSYRGGGGGLSVYFCSTFVKGGPVPVAPVRDQPDFCSLAVHAGACAISLIAIIT